MININDLYNLTSKILTTEDIVKFKDNMTVKLTVSKENLTALDNELFAMSKKPESEHQKPESISVTIQGIRYLIATK